MIKKPYRLAAAAVESKPGETQENLRLIHEACGDLHRKGAELVLFPELSVSGFLPNHPKVEHEPWLREGLKLIRNQAEPVPGPSVDRLVEIAREFDILLAAGLFEEAGPLIHNSHVLVGPKGILSVTRKMHIPIFEAPFYNGGGPPEVADTRLGRIGVSICFDTLLPESARLLAVENAELVLFPFASDPDPKTVEGWISHHAALLRTRCLENGFFGLVVNYAGFVRGNNAEMTFPGGGMFLAPNGKILDQWPGETACAGSMVVELDPDLLAEARAHPEFAFRFRRPELYGSLSVSRTD